MSLAYSTINTLAPSGEFEPSWGYNGMGKIIYARTYARTLPSGEKENWNDTLRRVRSGLIEIGTPLSESELDLLQQYMYDFKTLVSGRALWQLGTPAVRRFGQASLNNCYIHPLDSINTVCDMMSMLMLGGGTGYSVSHKFIGSFPTVIPEVEVTHVAAAGHISVSDDREGWVELMRRTLSAFLYTGESFTYDTARVRKEGAALKTFGGTASGPEVLIEGISDICGVIKARAGMAMRSVDWLDVMNIIGRIVIAGSARRSAQLALGDANDKLFLAAKDWAGGIPQWRGNSNNSIIANSFEDMGEEFWSSFEDGEPLGAVNLDLINRVGRLGEARVDNAVCVNPCGEAAGNHSVCNLQNIYLPNVKSYEEFISISSIAYKIQKHIAGLYHPIPIIRKTNLEEYRLGQSVTGYVNATEEQRSWLSPGYEALRALDSKWSKKIGAPESIRLTAVQPNGTGGAMVGVSPGMHAEHDHFYMRRVRFLPSDPLVQECINKGYEVCDDIGIDGKPKPDSRVVTFPCRAPEGVKIKTDFGAIDMLEMQKTIQTDWVDQQVSATVTYKKEELPEIKEWFAQNYTDGVKAVSFLQHNEHGFPLAPYESCTEQQYHELVGNINQDYKMNLSGASSDPIDECVGGACPIR